MGCAVYHKMKSRLKKLFSREMVTSFKELENNILSQPELFLLFVATVGYISLRILEKRKILKT